MAHDDTIILGISRRQLTAEEILAQTELCVNETDKICDPAALAKVQHALRMHQMSLVDGDEYDELRTMLNDIEARQGICMDRLYYLSIPPQMFEPIIKGLGQHGLGASCPHDKAATRLLVEKPFGYDTASARELLAETAAWFTEEQTFRIDHYAAKNSVVDLLDFRLSHPEISSIWNTEYIASIELTAYEQLDIEGRAIFYDSVGALRDIIQSHLLQVMAITMMDVASSQSTELHASRLALLQSVQQIHSGEVVERAKRAQYDGYRNEVGRDDSLTETYAEVRLSIDSERWQGVPVTLRTGKALSHKATEVVIKFREGAELICHIQPDTGLELVIDGHVGGGEAIKTIQAAMTAFIRNRRGQPRYTDAYERVLVEAAAGDATRFTTSDEIIAAWHIIQNVIEAWSKNDSGLLHYAKGSSEVTVG